MPWGKKKAEDKSKQAPVRQTVAPTQMAYPSAPPSYGAQPHPQQGAAMAMGQPTMAAGAQGQYPGAPPPYSAQGAPPMGYPAGAPPNYQGNPYPQGYAQPQGPAPPQGQFYPAARQPPPTTYVVQGGFDAGARFDGAAQPNIPPPPPGCAPNAAQMAVLQGQSVIVSQKPQNFMTGGSGGGYVMF